jgi:hypothetical protein
MAQRRLTLRRTSPLRKRFFTGPDVDYEGRGTPWRARTKHTRTHALAGNHPAP